MPTSEALAEEYRIAYEQLKAAERQIQQMEEQLQRDYGLAELRYQLARKAYLEKALGEDDQFLKPEDDAADGADHR